MVWATYGWWSFGCQVVGWGSMGEDNVSLMVRMADYLLERQDWPITYQNKWGQLAVMSGYWTLSTTMTGAWRGIVIEIIMEGDGNGYQTHPIAFLTHDALSYPKRPKKKVLPQESHLNKKLIPKEYI